MDSKTYVVKDICEIKSGKRLPAGRELSDDITPFKYIRARDIKGGKILSDGIAYIDEETRTKIKKYIINTGDVAITIVANIGDIGYCDENMNDANLTENAVRLTNFDKTIVNSRYLAYYLSQPFMKQYMEGLAAGAAQAKLGIYKIEKMKIQLPSIEDQNRIVDIVEKYDVLIENISLRIRLLEETAKNIYKEWFVRMRFPGWKGCKIIDGVPEIWNVMKMKDVFEVCYGKDHKNVGEGNIPILGSGGIMRCGDRSLYKKESVLIPRKGTLNNIMYMNEPFWTVDTMFYTKLLIENSAKYIYYTLSNIDMEALNSGAALPSMTTDILYQLKMIIPDAETLAAFDKIIDPYFVEIKKLTLEKENLENQKLLLVPRLISGKAI